jgi:polysaccharide export outer membrane protein
MDGTVYMPLLGEVKLAGMTEKEAGAYLSQRYRAFLKKPYVKVSITNTRIYVLGEVGKPGVIPIPPSGISLYEVLARSGDFTDYAKRNLINIISGPLGKQTIRTIDMTSLAAINASNLMIRPNSIVYVPPRSMKAVKVTIDDYMPIVRLISTSLSAYLSVDYIINGRD